MKVAILLLLSCLSAHAVQNCAYHCLQIVDGNVVIKGKDLVPQQFKINEVSHAKSFRDFAKKFGIEMSKEEAANRSFEFVSFEFPKKGLKIFIGSDKTHDAPFYREETGREVTFKKPFKIQKTPITNEQYRVFLEATGQVTLLKSIKLKNPLEPVVGITPRDVEFYANWLSMVTGKKYRLPTEAEYEFAMRGGTNSSFDVSNKKYLESSAWYVDNSGGDKLKIHPVAQLQANLYGLYDMAGNVYSWTGDYYKSDRSTLSTVDPSFPSAMTNDRVIRGGCTFSPQRELQPFYRAKHPEFQPAPFIGARLVEEP